MPPTRAYYHVMSFSLHYHPLLLLLCTLGAATMAWWVYRHTVPPLPQTRRVLLGALRFLTFFVLLFLLFEPLLRRSTTQDERPVLALLYDNSASIPLASGAANGTAPQMPQLTFPDDVEIRSFAFSSRLVPLPDATDAETNSLRFDGERTDIAAALAAVQNELRDDYLAGVVLVSDGQYNAGSNPLYQAERSPVPIHTIVFGDTTARRDLVVGRVSANRVAYAGVEQPVEVEVRAEGYEGTDVTVALHEGDGQLASERVRLIANTVQVSVELSYTPTETGLRSLRVSITEMDGEVTHANNYSVVPVRVLDQRRRVLVLAAAPDPDVATVRQILQEDRNVDLIVRVQKTRGAFYEGTVPDDLSELNAIVLAGYPGASADRATLTRIRAAVEDGVPAIFLLSRQTELTLLGELGDVLPVRLHVGRRGMLEVSLVPTGEGLQHPILTVPNATAADWQRLPPLLGSESRWTPSPDAQVLARSEVRGVALDDPLLVARSRAGMRTVAVLGANTWRWKNVPDDLRPFEHLWPSLLSNVLEWVTAAQDQRPVRVYPVSDVVAGGEAVQFLGEVYDERLHPVHDAIIDVAVVSDDGRQYPLRLRPAGNGRYILEDAALPEGRYEYQAVARRGELQLGRDAGTFVVGGRAIEQRETRADPQLMRQIAQRSGGVSLTSAEADRLPLELRETAHLAPRTASIEREIGLWRHPFFLILIVLCLSAEWVLRKRSGLV